MTDDLIVNLTADVGPCRRAFQLAGLLVEGRGRLPADPNPFPRFRLFRRARR